ncbi:hypothetical protein NECAME_05908, partial [Necator americanus]
ISDFRFSVCSLARKPVFQLQCKDRCSFFCNQIKLFCKGQFEKFRSRTISVPKTFHRLASDISNTEELQEYCKNAAGASVSLECAQCGRPIVETKPGDVTLSCMPSDDWLETSPSADYYCRDSCGAGCDPER